MQQEFRERPLLAASGQTRFGVIYAKSSHSGHRWRGHVRTRLSICKKKFSYPSEEEALAVARRSELRLRTYRCDRCRLFHL